MRDGWRAIEGETRGRGPPSFRNAPLAVLVRTAVEAVEARRGVAGRSGVEGTSGGGSTGGGCSERRGSGAARYKRGYFS